MRRLNKALVAAAALSMLASPVLAYTSAPARTVVQNGDAAMTAGGGAAAEWTADTWLLLLLSATAAISGIVAAADSDEDRPTSP